MTNTAQRSPHAPYGPYQDHTRPKTLQGPYFLHKNIWSSQTSLKSLPLPTQEYQVLPVIRRHHPSNSLREFSAQLVLRKFARALKHGIQQHVKYPLPPPQGYRLALSSFSWLPKLPKCILSLSSSPSSDSRIP